MSEETCKEGLYSRIWLRDAQLICDRPVKATVVLPGGKVYRVCGVHARQRERDMENVIWDATYDTPRGSRI